MKLLDRRNFLKIFKISNIILLFSSLLFLFYKFTRFSSFPKNRLFKIDKKKLSRVVNEFNESKIAITLIDGKINILSLVCTHLGCTLKWNEKLKVFECPCHRSIFDINGKVLKSPAEKDLQILKFIEKKDIITVWLENL